MTSLVTSLASLMGLIFTTAAARRKERREQAFADVELEAKKLEVEKLRYEVAEKAAKNTTPDGQSKVP